jgi:hypothetical protein
MCRDVACSDAHAAGVTPVTNANPASYLTLFERNPDRF